MRLQGALEVARVVAHAELSPDQRRDALQGPALGFEARFRRSAAQQPAEPSPSTGVEPRRSPGPGAGAQPAPALLLQNGGPAADAGTADTEMSGDRRLGHLPLPQQRCCCQASLLQLVRRQMPRTPLAAARDCLTFGGQAAAAKPGWVSFAGANLCPKPEQKVPL